MRDQCRVSSELRGRSPWSRARAFVVLMVIGIQLPTSTLAESTGKLEVRAEPISENLLSGIRAIRLRQEKRYSDLTRQYGRALTVLERLYPGTIKRGPFETVLQPYRGERKIEQPETLQLPYLLLAPRHYDFQQLAFERLTISLGAKDVPGLRIRSVLAGPQAKLPIPWLSELSITDINARAAGFRYAQLLLEHSSHVRPAAAFGYNGIRAWEEHERHDRLDHLSRPIELTTFAHEAGPLYVVSPHPNFALELNKVAPDPIVLTFFLWHEQPKAEQPPDFVFQLMLTAPGR
ncbi:MAG: hypothetical protein KDD69_09615 [Bdellovibrionales bacterium]|nr:hypothetical protein [Bdellovibrionales bacterium]